MLIKKPQHYKQRKIKKEKQYTYYTNKYFYTTAKKKNMKKSKIKLEERVK